MSPFESSRGRNPGEEEEKGKIDTHTQTGIGWNHTNASLIRLQASGFFRGKTETKIKLQIAATATSGSRAMSQIRVLSMLLRKNHIDSSVIVVVVELRCRVHAGSRAAPRRRDAAFVT